jgi:hypothetical protein
MPHSRSKRLLSESFETLTDEPALSRHHIGSARHRYCGWPRDRSHLEPLLGDRVHSDACRGDRGNADNATVAMVVEVWRAWRPERGLDAVEG